MPTQPMPIDNAVRQLTELGLSTRKMARRLGVAQSTIVRHRQKINTGPDPILPPGYRPRRRLALRPSTAMAAVAIALILLAAVAAVVVIRSGRAVPARSPQVQVCVRYSAAGNVTGITAGGGCPPGWQTITLMQGG